MNENKNFVKYNAGEIDIRDLFMALWKRKNTIISFTLIAAIITGIISTFVLSPVYNTNINIVIDMPEAYTTRFGEYILPITTNEQYINLIKSNDVIVNTIADMEYDSNVTVEKLKDRVKIEDFTAAVDSEQNSFDVTVSADNPVDSLKLAEILFQNYIEFLDVMTKERAVNYYVNNYNVQIKTLNNSLKSTKNILKKNEELLTQTPQVISKGESNIELEDNLNDDMDYVVALNNINPNYIKIENDIVSNKQSINYMENSIEVFNRYLEELEKEKIAINNYYQTGEIELDSSVTSVVATSIYLPSQPVASTEKSSPNTPVNILIGIAIGGIFGIIFALIKEYCFIKE